MQRFTISLDEHLAAKFDAWIAQRGYANRSEAVRDLVERLAEHQHAHHDIVVSTMHIELDHEHRMETVALRGSTPLVMAFSDAVCAERGVHHGKLNLVSVDVHLPHKHGHGPAHRAHVHLKPSH